MATDAETGTQIDAAAVWRAIGRMEGDIAALKDGQEETNRRLENGFLETNRRIDRITYTLIAVGSGLLVAILVGNFVGS